MNLAQTMKGVIPWLFFAVLVLAPSCKKKDGEPSPLKQNYFPVDIGHWVEYDVDSVVYDAFKGGADTTYSFQLREVVESSFTDNEGRTAYRLERYKRPNDTLNWTIRDVWFANRLSSRAEKVEENYRYVKLIFPPNEGERWDGNALNVQDEREYEYMAVDVPGSAGGFLFDSTLTVEQINDSNLIERKYVVEEYARHVGLIYKKYVMMTYKSVDFTPLEGVDMTVRLRDYRK